jgi:hypothetical protein
MNDVFSNFGDPEHRAVRAATATAALVGRDLARRAAGFAREDDEAAEETRRPDRVRDVDLLRHATRAPGDPVSFAVVAGLRNDETLRRRYATLVGLRATTHSPMAAAAYSEGTRRTVGPHVLRLMTDDDLPPILVISPLEEGAAPPHALEAMGPVDEGGFANVRIALPEAIRGHVTLPLDPNRPDLADLAKLLSRPDSALWLF